MIKKINKVLEFIPHKRFIIFCIGGGLGAIINWIISFFLTTILGVFYLISYTIAQIINISFNFLWNRNITFKVKSKSNQRFVKFFIVSISTAIVSVILVYIIKEFIVDKLYQIMIFGQDLNYLAAIMIVTFIVAVLNYLLNKLWVFKVKELPKNPKKILIIRSGGIGDVLMSTPLLKAVRNHYPKAEITYFIGNWSKDVLKDNPNLDKILSYDDLIIIKKRVFRIACLVKKIRKEKFDICFNLEKSWHWALLAYLFGIPYRIGFDRKGEGFFNTLTVPFEGLKYELEYYLDLARINDIGIITHDMEIYLAKQEIKTAENFIEKNKLKNKIILGIAPGGAENPGQQAFIKRWPIDNYIKLIDKLTEKNKNLYIILIGGNNDIDICKQIKEKSKHNKKIIVAAGKFTIKESAALIKYCKLFITHDSGPMHIAAAVKAPSVALFGPTQPERFAPRNAEVIEVKGENCPCYDIYGRFKECKKNCMSYISVNDVYSKIIKKIHN